ncbi:MAG TPA: DUF1801 domain-containing protein [Chitinophagales bacterium]|nr:DUF1801 domain-containing protein [Chitinophagales bacterium]
MKTTSTKKTAVKKVSIKPVKKTATKPSTNEWTNDPKAVDEYLSKLEHPLKAEIEAVRNIIKKADPKISERVKWNAPSFFFNVDLVTFNPRNESRVHLVFHDISITKVKSALLEGDYEDRRMTYLTDMKDVKAKKPELERIMQVLVKLVEKP